MAPCELCPWGSVFFGIHQTRVLTILLVVRFSLKCLGTDQNLSANLQHLGPAIAKARECRCTSRSSLAHSKWVRGA
jgi:hypothetical protein